MHKRFSGCGLVALTALLSGCQEVLQQVDNIAAPAATASSLSTQPAATLAPFQAFGSGHRPPFPFETEQLAAASLTEDAIAVEELATGAEHRGEANSKPDRTPPATAGNSSSADLWQRTRQHFALDLDIDHPRINQQLQWYIKHPRYLERVTERAQRYHHYVLSRVLARGLPAELALLPIVESAYDPFAYSHGRAAGPWQFIPGTAKHFGLRKSWWYDGRRDIRASTRAALDYLSQLHQRFDGDWHLALAAYNAGGGNVSKAIRYNKQRQRPTDFFSLELPRETRAYVPKLLALAKIFKQPQAYGLTLTPLLDEPYFAAVETGSQLDLAQAAELAATSIDELYLLNPGFNQWATDPQGPHELLVPVNNAELFRQALSELPKQQRLSWKRYKIRSGDSLIGIAKRNQTTVAALRTANDLRSNRIRAGQVLLIPSASRDAQAYALSSGQRQARKTQRIALRSDKQKLQYRVRGGDSFWTIARRYDVGVRELASWNQMAPGDPLRIGRSLVIWQPASIESASRTAPAVSSRSIIRKVGYKVRNGDSLWLIANRFKVSVKDIKRWNALSGKQYLKPGQQLTLYVDVTRSR